MKILFFSIAGVVLFFGAASAHGPVNFEEVQGSSTGMMRYIEDKAIGVPETHEEMEGLMEKMMTGKLTEEEAGKMTEFMQSRPGPFSVMMGRIGMGEREGKNFGNGWGGMMGDWRGGGYWINTILVWIFLGLGIAALWKWLQKEK